MRESTTRTLIGVADCQPGTEVAKYPIVRVLPAMSFQTGETNSRFFQGEIQAKQLSLSQSARNAEFQSIKDKFLPRNARDSLLHCESIM
jgi:hypothetical protein